jgi:hypothetical protein
MRSGKDLARRYYSCIPVHNLKRKIAFLECSLRITADKSFVFPAVDSLPVSSRLQPPWSFATFKDKYEVRSATVNFARNGPRLDALATTNAEEL